MKHRKAIGAGAALAVTAGLVLGLGGPAAAAPAEVNAGSNLCSPNPVSHLRTSSTGSTAHYRNLTTLVGNWNNGSTYVIRKTLHPGTVSGLWISVSGPQADLAWWSKGCGEGP